MNAVEPVRIRPGFPSLAWIRQMLATAGRRRGEILAMLGTVSTPAVNLVYGLLVFRNMTPEMAGLVATAAILPFYLTFLNFGVLNGQQRELPFALGAGDRERANRILQTASQVSLAAGTVGALVCVGTGLISLLLKKPPLLVLAFCGAGLGAFAYQVVTHTDIALRSENRYLRQAWAVIGTNLISLVTCALIPIAGTLGAIGRGALSSLGSLAVRWRTGLWTPGGRWNLQEARALSRTGLPLMISGALASLLMVADRTMVAVLLPKQEMGEFQLAGMIVNSLTFVPTSLSLILFPKIARAYGEHRSRRRLRRYVWISLLFNTATLIPVSALCFFIIGPVVERFFPAYAPGIPAARLACVTCVFWVYLGVGSVIGVINRMTPYLCALGAVLVIIFGASAWLIHLGHGIMGAAIARLIGTAILCVFTILYSLHLTSSEIAEPADKEGHAAG
ncbi:MAG: oligosaccharide flippase family protein [Verrucomicrobiae bacterium]|nr:oligosaccharide flippase family protein [Verrucomicrobiae bacterium]